MKAQKRSIEGKLYKHVHKKSKRNQNKDGDKYKSLWQGEWNHFMAFILCKIMPFFSNNYCYMRCHHQNMLHHIYITQIDNDNIGQGSKTIFGDDNVHSSSCVAAEKVKTLFLYMNSTLQCDSCNGISKHIMGYNVFIPTQAM